MDAWLPLILLTETHDSDRRSRPQLPSNDAEQQGALPTRHDPLLPMAPNFEILPSVALCPHKGNTKLPTSKKRSHALLDVVGTGGEPASADQRSNVEEPSRTFACPFYKEDPLRFMVCMNYKLSRISDVKQHIKRRHKLSVLCCSCCNIIFPTIEHLLAHSQKCQLISGPNYLKLGADAATSSGYMPPLRLARPARRKLDPVDQWYAIYAILCNNKNRPGSPYLDTTMGEFRHFITDIWKLEGPLYVSSAMQTHSKCPGDEAQHQEMFSTIMNSLLGRLEEIYIAAHPVEDPRRKKRDAGRPTNNTDASFPDFSISFISSPFSGNVDCCIGHESNTQDPILPNTQLGHEMLENTELPTFGGFEDCNFGAEIWDPEIDPASPSSWLFS